MIIKMKLMTVNELNEHLGHTSSRLKVFLIDKSPWNVEMFFMESSVQSMPHLGGFRT